jgi:hypothetical protein
MAAMLSRLIVLATGIGLGQIALDSVARGAGIALLQLVMAAILLVVGSAGFIVPLLGGGGTREVTRHA